MTKPKGPIPEYRNVGGQDDKLEAWKTAYKRGIAGDLCDRIVHTRKVPDALINVLATPPVARRRKLTRREQEVLWLLSHGWGWGNIAAALGIKPESVQTYTKNCRRKLGANTIHHAVAIAIRTFELI